MVASHQDKALSISVSIVTPSDSISLGRRLKGQLIFILAFNNFKAYMFDKATLECSISPIISIFHYNSIISAWIIVSIPFVKQKLENFSSYS